MVEMVLALIIVGCTLVIGIVLGVNLARRVQARAEMRASSQATDAARRDTARPFAEFSKTTPHFLLVGGPFHGRTVPTRAYGAWPQTIRMTRENPHAVCLYDMRIGDLEHYDYTRDEPEGT